MPKNPEKYLGDISKITFRSSWEKTFMQLCDTHPNIVGWGSEILQIPYVNPITKKPSIYIPDFLLVYLDKNGKNIAEVIEIKPMKETLVERAKSKRDQLMVAVNQYKWMAAEKFCKQNNMTFRVLTEQQIFRGKK